MNEGSPLRGRRRDYRIIKDNTVDNIVEFEYDKDGFLFDDYDIKEAYIFYKKYRMPDCYDIHTKFKFIESMQKYHKEIFDKWQEQGDKEWNKEWNNWLFDYCFADVIE